MQTNHEINLQNFNRSFDQLIKKATDNPFIDLSSIEDIRDTLSSSLKSSLSNKGIRLYDIDLHIIPPTDTVNLPIFRWLYTFEVRPGDQDAILDWINIDENAALESSRVCYNIVVFTVTYC